MNILNFTQATAGNFLVEFIAILIKGCGSIALGVIVFTLILKVITLPFDFISRASMRKNSLKLEQMRPELEKLQEQYANDKQLYQQKMMALYKKNGYSMMGSCLPTILTLVIFIVAINAFNGFSQYQNKQYIYNMSKAYNNVVYSGMELDAGETKYITRNEEGVLVFKGKELYDLYYANADGVEGSENVTVQDKNGNNFDIILSATLDATGKDITDNNAVIGTTYSHKMYVSTTNSFVQATLNFNDNKYTNGKEFERKFTTVTYQAIAGKLEDATTLAKLGSEENNFLKIQLLDADGNFVLDANGNKVEQVYKESSFYAESKANEFLTDISQQKSADKFREENEGLLWIKNIWVSDTAFKHPVESSWSEFKNTHKYEGNDIGDSGYANLTQKLSYEKSTPNGYFILVLLTAGSSLVTQLVMSKSQKAQMELQSVDGKQAQTQKIMMFAMPIMMAVFAFMYTAAFSIYIVINSGLGICTTLAINKIVDVKFKKQNEKEGKVVKSDKKRIHGRVYVPKQEEVKEEPKKAAAKNGKTQKEFEHGDKDFLSGKQDNKKHVRGRLK